MSRYIEDSQLPIFFSRQVATKGQLDQMKNVFQTAINNLADSLKYTSDLAVIQGDIQTNATSIENINASLLEVVGRIENIEADYTLDGDVEAKLGDYTPLVAFNAHKNAMANYVAHVDHLAGLTEDGRHKAINIYFDSAGDNYLTGSNSSAVLKEIDVWLKNHYDGNNYKHDSINIEYDNTDDENINSATDVSAAIKELDSAIGVLNANFKFERILNSLPRENPNSSPTGLELIGTGYTTLLDYPLIMAVMSSVPDGTLLDNDNRHYGSASVLFRPEEIYSVDDYFWEASTEFEYNNNNNKLQDLNINTFPSPSGTYNADSYQGYSLRVNDGELPEQYSYYISEPHKINGIVPIYLELGDIGEASNSYSLNMARGVVTRSGSHLYYALPGTPVNTQKIELKFYGIKI